MPPQESELTPTGANLLDGRYAVFGYVTEGAQLLKEMQVGWACGAGVGAARVLPASLAWVCGGVVPRSRGCLTRCSQSWLCRGRQGQLRPIATCLLCGGAGKASWRLLQHAEQPAFSTPCPAQPQVGDKIESAKIVKGAENLVQPK